MVEEKKIKTKNYKGFQGDWQVHGMFEDLRFRKKMLPNEEI